jgi:hypothetical protein
LTLGWPSAGCVDLSFQAGYPISEPAEVALEDYARAVMRAEGAEAVRASDEPGRITGVHVCGMTATLTSALLNDVEDFARGLATRGDGPGLGWS